MHSDLTIEVLLGDPTQIVPSVHVHSLNLGRSDVEYRLATCESLFVRLVLRCAVVEQGVLGEGELVRLEKRLRSAARQRQYTDGVKNAFTPCGVSMGTKTPARALEDSADHREPAPSRQNGVSTRHASYRRGLTASS